MIRLSRWIGKRANIHSFLIIFCLCFCLETISSTYLISSLQSIERQFHIGSQLSGILVSLSEIGYVLTVVLLAYLGSRGNRARWIGSGCLLIALACFLISVPYFIFPYSEPEFNITSIRQEVSVNYLIHPKEVSSAHKLLHHRILGPRLPEWATKVLKKMESEADLKLEEEDYDRYFELFIGDKVSKLHRRHISFAEPIQSSAHYEYMDASKLDESLYDNYDYSMDTGLFDPSEAYSNFPMDESLFVRKKRQIWNISDEVKGMLMDVSLGNRRFVELARPISTEVNNLIVELFSTKKLDRLLSTAELPFTYCNQLVVGVKEILQRQKCQAPNTNNIAVGIICSAVILIGVGHSMPWTLGMPLIDDNVKKESAPAYFAIVFFLRVMGPLLGFVLGAVTNKIYFTLKEIQGMTIHDGRWIGAWWLGFLIISVCLFMPSVLLFLFPRLDREIRKLSRRMSSYKMGGPKEPLMIGRLESVDHPTLEVRRKTSILTILEPRNAWAGVKEFLLTIWIILKCPVFVGSNFSRMLEAFTMKGVISFEPKFLEYHYGIPQYKANIYLGLTGVLLFSLGVIAGSFVMKRFKLDGRRAALYLLVLSLITGFFTFSTAFISCHSVVNNIGQVGRQLNFNYTTKCNAGCECENSELFPVCDRDGRAYYSPCHAGCRNFTVNPDDENDFVGSEANKDWCQDDCRVPIVIFLTVISISSFISGCSVIPAVLMMMRSVPDEHRSIALGFGSFCISLFSTLPAPIVYGTLFDSVCLLWSKNCEKVGSCAIYDPQTLRKWFFGFSGAIRISTIFSDAWVLYWAKDVKLLQETDEDKLDE